MFKLKKTNFLFHALFIQALTLFQVFGADYKVIGFCYSRSSGELSISDMDFSKITHFNYGFIGSQANNTEVYDGEFNQVDVNLIMEKARQNNVKVFVSLWAGYIPDNISGDESLYSFAQNLLNYCIENGYDGLDVDWEPLNAESKGMIVKFMKKLYPLFNAAGLEVSFDLPGGSWYGQYVDSEIFNYVDWFNVMSYDFNGPGWSSQTLPNACYNDALGSISYWEGRGIASSKLIMGLPFYGRGYGNHDNPFESYTVNEGVCADCDETGYISYSKIVELININGYNKLDGGNNAGDYITNGNEIIFYDGRSSIKKKCEWIKDNNYPGVMIWELTLDRKENSQSLLATIAEGLNDVPVKVERKNDFNEKKISIWNNENNLSIKHSSQWNSIKIYSISGRLILKKDLEKTNNGAIKIPFIKANQLVYITLSNNESTYTTRYYNK